MPVAVHFLPVVVQLFRRQPAQHEGARIDAGGRMALHEDEVAAVVVARRVPEVIETDVVEHRRRREARDVPADVGVLVRAQHHGHRVPADAVADLLLDVEVARQVRLLVDGNRVDVGRVRGKRKIGAGLPRGVDEVLDQVMRAVGTFGGEHAGQRVQPFACFLGIGIAFHHVHRDSPEDDCTGIGFFGGEFCLRGSVGVGATQAVEK